MVFLHKKILFSVTLFLNKGTEKYTKCLVFHILMDCQFLYL